MQSNEKDSAHHAQSHTIKSAMAQCLTPDVLTAASSRLEDLDQWLHETEQQHLLANHAHLDKGAAARAYWHAGYASALQDLFELIKKSTRDAA